MKSEREGKRDKQTDRQTDREGRGRVKKDRQAEIANYLFGNKLTDNGQSEKLKN